MDVTIIILGLGGIVVLTFLTGYLIGRRERGDIGSGEEEERDEKEVAAEEREHIAGRSRPGDNRRNI